MAEKGAVSQIENYAVGCSQPGDKPIMTLIRSDTRHRVMIFEADYDTGSMVEGVEAAFDAFPLDLAGKRVLVKPNILGGHAPEKAVTTHPALVAAVVEYLKKNGATPMVGDNSGVHGYGRSGQAARVSKIMDAAGDCFISLGRKPVRQDLVSRDIRHVMIAEDVLTADIVINLPKLKTHGLTFYTGAVKNTFGYVTGGDKMRVHALAVTPQRFAEALVDIYAIRPPDLSIMDAVEAMEGNGPSNGRVRRVGKILASDNAVPAFPHETPHKIIKAFTFHGSPAGGERTGDYSAS